MAVGTVFLNNRSQAVRIPKEAAFPPAVRKVEVHRVGRGLLLTPQDWGIADWLEHGPTLGPGFMADYSQPDPQARDWS
jgi:antitoxin VapB